MQLVFIPYIPQRYLGNIKVTFTHIKTENERKHHSVIKQHFIKVSLSSVGF